MTTHLTLTPTDLRHLALSSQGLASQPAAPTRDDMLAAIRQIRCVQLDPINAVARSPLLVLWSRLGAYDEADLNALLWDDRALFEYWAHAASIVLAEDFPIFQRHMVDYKLGNGKWAQNFGQWVDANDAFRQYVLDELGERGPLYSDQIEDRTEVPWESSGWSSGKSATRMLDYLWLSGQTTVTNRKGAGFGLRKQWGLLEHQLPGWVDHEVWPEERVVADATQKALRPLGAGRLRDIKNYFVRNRYPSLPETLDHLIEEGVVHPATIVGDDGEWPDTWYIHNDSLPLLAQIQRGEWQGQTVLLSPFDNLIADRDRTELLFDFYYRIEIYVPKAKREYGYYSMPILHGDRLIGRLDPKLDRKTNVLAINAFHLEPGVTLDAASRTAVEATIDQLAAFVGAETITYPPDSPVG